MLYLIQYREVTDQSIWRSTSNHKKADTGFMEWPPAAALWIPSDLCDADSSKYICMFPRITKAGDTNGWENYFPKLSALWSTQINAVHW